MSENNSKDKFSLDDILNEYTPKAKTDGGIDVEDIISETNMINNQLQEETPEQDAAAEEVLTEQTEESAEEQTAEVEPEVAEEPAETPSEPLADSAENHDVRHNPIGSILDRFEENAEELDSVIDGQKIPEPAEEQETPDEETLSEEGEETVEAEPVTSYKSRKGEKNRGAAFTMRTDDDGDTDKIPTKQSEYKSPKDTIRIKKQIEQLKSSLTVRAAVLLFASVFSLFITAANDLGLPLAAVFDRTVNPSAYLFTNTILGIVAVGFSYSVIVMGIKSIFRRKPDSDSIAAINIIIAIIAGLVMLFDPESLKASFFHLYTSAAIVGLLCNTLGKLCIVRRTQRNFEFVSETESFAAVQLVEDDQTVTYLTNGSAGKRKELATLRRTGFVDDFMKNSYSSDLADRYAEKAAPLMLAAALIVGLLSLFFEKNSAGMEEKLFVFLASISGTLSICSSFALTLIVNLPLANASKKLVNYSGVMLGYSSVEEFAEVNSVVIDAGHLFPTGTVEFVNLKLLGSTMIDECIVYAASMASAGKSVTQPAFYKMLRGELDMLLPVKGCVSEDNMGVSGWIENKRVLLGNRQLMEKHGIDGLPPAAAEDSFADGNCIMYLAVSGRAAMMFAVQLSVGPSAERWVQELEDSSIDIHVRCSDGFITRELIAQLFDISASAVRLLPSNCDEDCAEITSYADRLSASMFCSGHLPSFSMLLVAAKKVKFAANLGVALQYGAMILGIVISVIMMFTGSFAQITPTITVIYNLAFLLLTYLMQGMKKI